MRDPNDLWYVRLPDGRVVRAGSTRALRYHLRSGRVPWNSWVRRSGADDWATVEWTSEFADLRKPEKKQPPTKGTEPATDKPPRPLGVRGLSDELLNALESSFNPVKLGIAAGTGSILALSLVAYRLSFSFLEAPWNSVATGIGAALAFFLFCLGTLTSTRMTVLELARRRPARPREVRSGLLRRTLALCLAQLLSGGLLLGTLALLPHLRDWIDARGADALPEGLRALFAGARLVVEMMCWPALALAFLLAPILVVESTGPFGTIRRWWSVLRVHLGRILVYEALALAIGLVVTLPFLAPVAFAAWQGDLETGLPGLVHTSLLLFFGGLALTPLLSYFTVANVSIYLNVQYEFSHADGMKRV